MFNATIFFSLISGLAMPEIGCGRQYKQDGKNEVKIVSKNAIRAIGLTIKTTFQQNRQATEVPKFFHDTFESGILDTIDGRINKNQLCIFLINPNSPDFSYFMGVEVNEHTKTPQEFTEHNLGSNLYASLEIIKRGNKDVMEAFKYILEEWMPESGYKPGKAPAFIYYDDRFIESYKRYGYKNDPPATIFIPVVPKTNDKV